MTAHALEFPATAEVRIRPARTGRPAPSRPTVTPHREGAARTTAWSHRQAQACAVSVPAPRPAPASVPVGDGRLYWTPRGVAAMVWAVALTVGIMLATVVSSFLAVSDAPVAAPPAPIAAAASSGVAGG